MWRTALAKVDLTPSNLDEATPWALPRAVSCSFDPNAALLSGSAMIQEAAYGDLSAQRVLRGISTDAAFAMGVGHPHALPLAMEMTMAARLCAAHRYVEDARCLAGALCFVGDVLREMDQHGPADSLQRETVAILERLAADGDEYSAMASESLVKHHPGAGPVAALLMKAER
jgi:hypothetical protein